MTVEVTTNLLSEISPRQMGFLKKLASRVIRYTLRREGVDSRKVQVSVLFTCDDFIASLNKRYRDEDGSTDVLAFPMSDDEDDIEPEESPMPYMLGDIVISLDTAARQAESQGRPLRQELALLLVHGTLHLLGYDHMTEEDKKIMRQREEELLAAVGLIR